MIEAEHVRVPKHLRLELERDQLFELMDSPSLDSRVLVDLRVQ